MNWENLKYVLALARTGTMSAAAAELNVNHSTVSRRIAAFQQELGVPLFVATPDGWDLTAVGEELVESCQRIEEEVMEIDRSVLARDEQLNGTLRVASVDTAFAWLGSSFVDFSRRYPNIRLEFAAHTMPANLTRREADVAIRVTSRPPETLVGRRVGSIGYAVYASHTLAATIRDTSGPWLDEELARLPWLSWDFRAGAVVTEAWIERIAGAGAVVARYDSTPVKISHTRAGMGAACLPCHLMEPLPDVVRLTPVLDGFDVDLWLLTHPDLRRSARVRAFMDHFEVAITDRAAELRGPCAN